MCDKNNDNGKWFKYKKYFVPHNCGKSDEAPHVDSGGFLNVVFFLWIIPLVKKGMRKTLEIDDLNALPEQMKSQQTLNKVKHYLQQEYHRVEDKEKISLLRVYFNLVFAKLLTHVCVFTAGVTAGCVGTGIVARYLFEYIESPQHDTRYGCMLVSLMIVAIGMKMLGVQLGIFLGRRIGCYAKSAFLGLVYEKALKLKSTGSKSVGELVNLCANDATRIMDFSSFSATLVSTPVTVTWVMVYLTIYIGPVVLVGFGIFLLYFPISVLIGCLFTYLRKRTVGYSDKRVKMISEALTFVKLIKMYAWEKPFSNVVYKLRKKERFAIQWMAFVESSTESTSYIIATVAPVFTIIVAVYTKQDINISKAFTLLAIYMMLKGSMKQSQNSIRRLAEMIVSFRRIKDFLNMEETGEPFKQCVNSEHAVEVKSATFAWKKVLNDEDSTPKVNSFEESDKIPRVEILTGEENTLLKESFSEEKEIHILKNITINIKKKSLVGICGVVGCGKSSFLQALLNEMNILSGHCTISSSIAYVPQQPWVMNATIRDNVVFGNDYDSKLFKDVCRACALDEDLQSMPSGELTEIGERGITLSGGQKQRVSLARALYARKELYLLDDPLSAVDANVGKYIFENYIQTALRDATVLLVTHQLQYLQECDHVIHMKDGSFSEQGTYDTLMKEDAMFAAEIRQYHTHHQNDRDDCRDDSLPLDPIHQQKQQTADVVDEMEDSDSDREEELTEKGRIIQEEDKKDGAVTLATYHSFIQFCGGYCAMLLVIVGIGSSVAFQVMMDYWLSLWLKKSDVLMKQLALNSTVNTTGLDALKVEYVSQRDYYMTIYGVLSSCMILVTFLFSFYTVFLFLHGSTFLHNAVFKAIFASPMSFFDTTPSGRILNRLTKDVDDIDHYLPLVFRNFIQNCARVLGMLVFIAISIPYFLIVLFVMVVLFGLMNVVYRKVVRAIKRVENVTRSPVYSHLTATAQGLVTIRSYDKQELFTQMFRKRLDLNIGPLLYFYGTSRWFGTSVDMICIICAFSVCIAVVLLKGQIEPTIAALCVAYGIRMFGLVQFTFRLFADLEAKFTSVERLDHFVKTLKSEWKFVTDDVKMIEPWPKNGNIEFDNVSLRYRENLPLVLKDMSMRIADKEKIGIVGRTGAGKSSIMVALYRLVNPTNGSIKIDGVDTKSIGLKDLRSSLTIIPQDPVMFIGSIRYNLDPFQQYDDRMLWNALEKAHIKELISNLPLKLESPVQEHGANFSVGERQLICMARALLRKTKILVLDEATASIDSISDFKIQQTIRECFADCTVLTIAHRLNTIMDSDKVMVMADGQVVEFDTPFVLLSKDSLFRRMRTAASLSQQLPA